MCILNVSPLDYMLADILSSFLAFLYAYKYNCVMLMLIPFSPIC